jgi:hypothetical protein
MNRTNRQIILKALFDKISQISEAGYVLPAPQIFVDAADFWALADPKITQKEIETTPVAYLMISRRRFEDEDPVEEGCEDNPLTFYDYNFRLFRQFYPDRVDESETPNDFLKRLNSSYETFCDAIDALKSAFQGVLPVDNLPEGWLVETNSLTQDDENQDIVESEEVPGVVGFLTDLGCRAAVLIND